MCGQLGPGEDSPQSERHRIRVIVVDHESGAAREQLNRVGKRCRDDWSSGGNGVNEDTRRHLVFGIVGQNNDCAGLDQCGKRHDIAIVGRLGLDPGSATVLERYQRWRRFDTVTMGIATDGLNRLFSNRSDVLRLVRDVGLGLVDRVPNLKRLFIREAAGLVGEVPKLLRGEVL